MSNHANYAKIGAAVVLGAVALLGVLVYLGGVGAGDDFSYAETYYDTSVSGLSVGSAVNFRGVKIGEVKEITFVGTKYAEASGADARRIYILMAISRRTAGEYADRIGGLVARGLRATVTASGVTGLSRMELDVRRDAPPPPAAKLAWTPRHVYVPAQPSLLDSFSDSATKVMNQINRMDLDAAWSNIHSAVESMARASEGVCNMLETRRGDFDRIVEDAAEAASSLRDTAAELRRNPSLLVRERKAAPLDETE
ncbi:MAG: MCE family protein [Kiritimatiellae bacterium]|nr:MCE family protein [Kiritimatiellia bacterium]